MITIPEGYEEISTGGGCTAWHRPIINGRYYVLITVDGGADAPSSQTDACIVGFYAADQQRTDQVCSFAADCPEDAVRLASRLLCINLEYEQTDAEQGRS